MSSPKIPPMHRPDPRDPMSSSWAAFQVIGSIRTPFLCVDDVPSQPYKSRAEGRAEIDPAFEMGLVGLEGFSHVILLYLFHRVREQGLQVRSRLDGCLHGVFATREPIRPTPIGMSVVRLVHRQARILWLYGVDMLDQTPLIDIKPYVPAFDRRDAVSIGWMEGKVPT